MVMLTKHIGKIKGSDTKVIVLFMELPEDPGFSLVSSTDAMHDSVKDEILELVASPEAQKEKELAAFLKRRTLRSGEAGVSVLDWLHNRRLIQRVSTNSVIMTPAPNTIIQLDELLNQMKNIEMGSSLNKKSSKLPDEIPASVMPESRFIKSEDPKDIKKIAENLLIEAEMLRNDANKKEESAKNLLNSLENTETKVKTPATKKPKKKS